MEIQKHTPRRALRLESEEGGRDTKALSLVFLEAYLTAGESPLNGERYRASITSKMVTLEVLDQAEDQMCPSKYYQKLRIAAAV